MKTKLFILCIAAIVLQFPAFSQQQESDLLAKAPPADGYLFRCGDMVKVVNGMRLLGKDKAIAVMEKSLSDSNGHTDTSVLLVCRLLFVNPDGWKPPRIGSMNPAVDTKQLAQFPLFPLAISDGVPFFLLNGYLLGGRGESALKCLQLCKGFQMISEDLKDKDFTEAAKKLTESDSFKKLYLADKDRKEMSDVILHQADIKR